MADLLLASASPRRRELLEQIGVSFISEPQDIDETPLLDESPEAYVERLAREKAQQGAQQSSLPVLGSDTCVVLDGEILSKPNTKADACAMLSRLSGRSHHVLTAIAICTNKLGEPELMSQVVSTEVQFNPLAPTQIEDYVATGEPMDKAGAYAVQGGTGQYIRRIEGSYSGVMGLPLFETAELLRRAGVMT